MTVHISSDEQTCIPKGDTGFASSMRGFVVVGAYLVQVRDDACDA